MTINNIAKALKSQGFQVIEVVKASKNADAGIFLSDSVSVTLGASGVRVTTASNDGFNFGETHSVNDLAGLFADVKQALAT